MGSSFTIEQRRKQAPNHSPHNGAQARPARTVARRAPITLCLLPPNIWEEAQNCYRQRFGLERIYRPLLEAFVRHRYTNYDELLCQLRRYGGDRREYKELRMRVDKEVRRCIRLSRSVYRHWDIDDDDY